MRLRDYYEFEKCVAEIFNLSGYDVQTNVILEDGQREIDIVAVKDETQYFVEVKFFQVSDRAVSKINDCAIKSSAKPVLIIGSKISDAKREYYSAKYPDVELVDIANLLYAIQDNEDIRNRLISILPYSVEDLIPKKGLLQSETLKHSNIADSLIIELGNCIAGRSMARKYEEICRSILEYIFHDDLALWRSQQKSNNELYRFDLLCRIKDNIQKPFWSVLERHFNSKYIVFEFKNYNDPVSQKEIYTTEKYLYAKALRCVAIVIAANGFGDNAEWAAKGCLRENGKLIILLNNDDLIEMVKMQKAQDDPSDYLFAKLDELLLELEK